jgi:DNA (cytosine-5)-methyltransferase 1
MTDLSKLTKKELLEKCKEHNIQKCSSKTKSQIIELLSHVIPQEKNKPIVVPPTPKDAKFKFIDLFCGVGGFHQALNKLGGHCVFASDIDEHCRNIYEKNYGLRPHGDITKVDPKTIPDFDILTGGFPCQSFSNSGKKGGFGDKRGQLYENILEIASEKKPSYMFLENVKHIQKIDNGEVFKHILGCIQNTGYHVETFELSPHQLGVPQQRERVIFVCIRNDLYDKTKELDMTPPEGPIDFKKIIETDPEKTKKYKISPEHEEILTIWDEMVKEFEVGQSMSPTILCNEFNSDYSVEAFAKLPQWKQDYITKNKPIYQKYKPLWDKWYEKHKSKLSKREIYAKLEWQAGPKKENDSIFNHFIQFRQSGIRVKKSKYFPTLVAIVQTPIYAKERRHITPRECARLQSFPDSFQLHESDQIAYKQFGNAVNVDVVHFVMSRVLKIYNYV